MNPVRPWFYKCVLKYRKTNTLCISIVDNFENKKEGGLTPFRNFLWAIVF